MRLRLNTALLSIAVGLLTPLISKAQVSLLQDYVNNKSASIGTFQGINFREAGFSSLYPIANTNGKEFWTISDRGVNVDCANANPAECHPTYDKLYAFPNYAPKIHRIRVNGDSIQILQSITMKRPNGTSATGLLNPAGYGSTDAEQNSTDTVLTCANFAAKTAAKDIWGIDSEGIVVDKDGNFWICEEGGPTIWKLNKNGVVVKRFTPYANLSGAQPEDVAIDTVFKYRKNNRGFEGISITPNGKIYAIIQSPILYPTTAVGEASRIHRILEIDPATNATRMFAYVNEGVIGSGANQVRLKDWKIGDMAAINNNEFLLIEVGIRGTTDSKKVYKIDISGATPVTSGLYGDKTLEALVDDAGLSANGIVPVGRTMFLDLVANGWPAALDKAEGLAIINDSTIALCNDNDYGQSSPNADGVAIATSNLSHMFVFGLKGANKLSNYVPFASALAEGTTGMSTSTSSYLAPITAGVKLTSILTAKDVIGNYKMCGTPDGLGAFDNNDGTFTLLMNHEFVATAGVARAHGSTGSFVSKWVINKSDLTVISGSDLIQNVNLWNGTEYTTYNSANPSALTAFGRFCSADLPAVSAYYNAKTGLGTQARIFMNGEESGNEGRVMGHIASGPAAGTSYELPALGKASWENLVARPVASDKTVVIGMDDSTPGQVYVYIGTKTNSGSDVEKAGLINGKLYGVSVTGMLNEANANFAAAGTTFTLVDLGDVKNQTGATINTNSNNLGVTNFLRPEDGAWDPSNLNDFYFNTTNAITSPSRLWRLRFSDINNPEAGGTVEAVLDGTEGQKMLDNLTIDHFGHVLLVEDVGGDAHIGRVLQYNIATDELTTVAEHDRTRFLNGGANFLTQDEEASGILDMQEILGPGMFLTSDQAHYGIAGEVVEGGQLLALFNPDSYNANPEISFNSSKDFGTLTTGYTTTKDIVISNAGPGALTIKAINFSGTEYVLDESLIFPISIAAGESKSLVVKFAPVTDGAHNAAMTIVNNDFDESTVEVSLTGISSPEEIPAGLIPSGSISSNGMQIFPNPAGDLATVSITMEKAEHVTISILNSKGTLVAPVIEKELAAGKTEVALSTASLQNGIYVVKLSSASGTKTVKAVVAH
ncbi:MAG: esterase-like activity of phytase family protein [Sporocytophaga sp.]|uniref:esterase-like activity of phytase family protein n=1 Tax=Sporocytophaga sp. TaxID=2231183 RepID=UPI001B2B991A|nr:esterase-like activity of phytase family protein [Sporocytophaga sp.]MBO9700441.1 esterase-like activity of phytase family protein [Sporocytophaga sp.]